MKTNTSERIKEFMSLNGYRQVDILKKCQPYCEKYNVKLGRNDLSQYVSGKVTPGQEKLTILSRALNVNEAWLMGYDVPMTIESSQKSSDAASHEDNEITQEYGHDIGQNLDQILKDIENDINGPLFYNGKPIDDESLLILRNALKFGMMKLKKDED